MVSKCRNLFASIHVWQLITTYRHSIMLWLWFCKCNFITIQMILYRRHHHCVIVVCFRRLSHIITISKLLTLTQCRIYRISHKLHSVETNTPHRRSIMRKMRIQLLAIFTHLFQQRRVEVIQRIISHRKVMLCYHRAITTSSSHLHVARTIIRLLPLHIHTIGRSNILWCNFIHIIRMRRHKCHIWQ